MQAREYSNVGRTLASSRSVAVDEEEEEEEEERKKGNTRKYLLSCGLRTDRHRRGGKYGVVLCI